jgi:hypothetical protein
MAWEVSTGTRVARACRLGERSMVLVFVVAQELD